MHRYILSYLDNVKEPIRINSFLRPDMPLLFKCLSVLFLRTQNVLFHIKRRPAAHFHFWKLVPLYDKPDVYKLAVYVFFS